MKRKALLFLGTTILLFTASLILPQRTQAAPPWSPSYDMDQSYLDALDEGPNLVNWMGHTWMYGLQTVNLAVNGTAGGNASVDANTKQVAGLVDYGGMALDGIYTTRAPYATVTYLASINPIKPAYAKTGTDHLNFILNLWKIFRNVAYTIMTVILVLIGFMIMFGKKTDPYTEITVVSALPRIIIVLLLITFSYAISGLLYDASIVSKSFINNLLTSLDSSNTVPTDFSFVRMYNTFGMGAFGDAFRGTLKGPKIGKGFLSLGAGALFNIIFGIAMFTVVIKLLIQLIKYFAQWFLLTAFGPILLAIGALPQSSEVIGWWLRKLLVANIVFPATHALLNIAFYLREVAFKSSAVHDLPLVAFFGASDADLSKAKGIANMKEFTAMIIVWGLVLASASLPQAIDNLFAGELEGRVDTVDLGSAIRKLPIVGGLAG